MTSLYHRRLLSQTWVQDTVQDMINTSREKKKEYQHLFSLVHIKLLLVIKKKIKF